MSFTIINSNDNIWPKKVFFVPVDNQSVLLNQDRLCQLLTFSQFSSRKLVVSIKVSNRTKKMMNKHQKNAIEIPSTISQSSIRRIGCVGGTANDKQATKKMMN